MWLQLYVTLQAFPNERRFGKLTWNLGNSDDAQARKAFARLYQICGSCFITEDPSLHDVGLRIKSDGIKNFNAIYGPNETVYRCLYATRY